MLLWDMMNLLMVGLRVKLYIFLLRVKMRMVEEEYM